MGFDVAALLLLGTALIELTALRKFRLSFTSQRTLADSSTLSRPNSFGAAQMASTPATNTATATSRHTRADAFMGITLTHPCDNSRPHSHLRI
ncbi:hypothetical protein XW60_23050 [Mycobacteroides abscessus subsp. bolletii]|nr:hypothetical protein BST18_11675 [Mycobacteroides abscessus subsp. bolletii]TPF65881.1 hypothetical protein XW60_23050 [Mycobacteroides abscessus subsp. bolletii]